MIDRLASTFEPNAPLIGDADGGSPPRVNALDVAAVKRALNTAAGPDNKLDFNRDGRINALDVAVVKQNLNRTLPPAYAGGGCGCSTVESRARLHPA